jgi:biopolymer transport protein ExbB
VRTLSWMFRRVPTWLLVATVVLVAGSASVALAAEGDAGGDAEKMSLLELLMKGQWFMVPIGLCSLLGVALIIERLVALRRTAAIPKGFVDDIDRMLGKGEGGRREAIEFCRAHPSPIARVTASGLRKAPKGEEAVEQSIEMAGASEITRLRRNLRMLYGVSAVAPMLGLLGTVWGMIEAFQVASAMGLGRAEKLASGIYEALVTTFAGLSVAIPCLIFYYYFQGKIDAIITEMDDASVYLLETHMGDDPLPQKPASQGAAPQPGTSASPATS